MNKQSVFGRARSFWSCLACLGVLALCASRARGQEVEPKTLAELTMALQELQRQMASFDQRLTQLGAPAAGDESGSEKDLEGRVKTLEDAVQNVLTTQQQILNQVSRMDSGGRHIIDLRANMQSQEFRQELSDAVHESMRSEGTLTIRNKMSTAQYITINQTRHLVQPAATLALNVPIGTVSTRLPGQEIVNWTIGAPKYSQTVDIVPRETSTVETITTMRPIYPTAETWGYVDPWTGYIIYP